MKTFFIILLLSVRGLAASADLHSQFTDPPTWSHFDGFMHAADEQDQKIGWSYVASGVLVMVGGTLGAQYASDGATRIVYGVAATLGVGAFGYGLERLYNGNNFTSFHESVLSASLTEDQRNQLVARFIEVENEKALRRRRIAMVTNYVMGGLNLYSASQASDKSTKDFFYTFAAINLGLALSYSF